MSWSDYVLLDDVMKVADHAEKAELTKATRVNIQDIATGIFTHKEGPEVDKASLKGPYRNMWLEYETGHTKEDPNRIDQVGVWLRWESSISQWRRKVQLAPGTHEVIEAEVCMRIGNRVVKWPGLLVIALDERGFFLGSYAADSGGLEAEQYKTMVIMVKVALSAVALMNCKNVALMSHERATKPSKKSRRVKQPKLSFNTIKLPGVTYSSNGSAEMSKGDMAHHLVRGHFKTYTAERPLLGKATGTYWWAPQARGKKANGIVVKDYEVGV